jgi:hypothetical protein
MDAEFSPCHRGSSISHAIQTGFRDPEDACSPPTHTLFCLLVIRPSGEASRHPDERISCTNARRSSQILSAVHVPLLEGRVLPSTL